MILLLRRSVFCLWTVVTALASAQSASTSGYVGYNLTLQGDEDSVIFSTDETRPDAGQDASDADVYLNATGEPREDTCFCRGLCLTASQSMLERLIWKSITW